MDVQVLGAVEASVDGRSIRLGGGKPRALLAMLALDAGSTVSTARLIDGLWGEAPPATANKLVQVYVSQLRKALAAGGDGPAIVTRRHGYELCGGPDAVDAARFARLVATGAPREALALWRGAPLVEGPRARRGGPARWGGARRSTTSPTSRLQGRRSGGWRSCAWPRSSSRSSKTS